MKNPRIHAVLIVAIIAAFTAILSLSARNSSGQSPAAKTEQQNPKIESLVKPIVMTTERPAANASNITIAPFAEAASQNSVLRDELTWSFGRKGQRGWYLYDLLIGETLNISHNASSVNF